MVDFQLSDMKIQAVTIVSRFAVNLQGLKIFTSAVVVLKRLETSLKTPEDECRQNVYYRHAIRPGTSVLFRRPCQCLT